MTKRTGPTSLALKKLIIETKKLGVKEKSPFWKTISEELSKPTRKRRTVNIRTINKTIQEGETAVIPGNVLSDGELTVKKAIVAAYQFSDTAKEKINKTGKAINLTQLMKDNPKAQNVRIFG